MKESRAYNLVVRLRRKRVIAVQRAFREFLKRKEPNFKKRQRIFVREY